MKNFFNIDVILEKKNVKVSETHIYIYIYIYRDYFFHLMKVAKPKFNQCVFKKFMTGLVCCIRVEAVNL